jgi:uncharacterized protein YraI
VVGRIFLSPATTGRGQVATTATSAPAIGTAPKGTQFTATGREGDWVQVENTRLKGWINSQFLAADKPQ